MVEKLQVGIGETCLWLKSLQSFCMSLIFFFQILVNYELVLTKYYRDKIVGPLPFGGPEDAPFAHA